MGQVEGASVNYTEAASGYQVVSGVNDEGVRDEYGNDADRDV
jgi:hypothetical protein